MRKMKKYLLAALGFSPVAVFAQAQDATPDGLADAIASLQGAATATVTAVRPAVVAVVVALFGLVAIVFAFRWIRKLLGR